MPIPCDLQSQILKKFELECLHVGYDMKKSGMRIRQLRIKNSLTQEQTAEALNIDRSFYSRIEAGKSGCSVNLAVQLSELFNVSLNYLILGRYSTNLFKDIEKSLLKGNIEKAIHHLKFLSSTIELQPKGSCTLTISHQQYR